MSRINLLPWREELRQKKQKQFLAMVGGCILIAVGIAFLAVIFVQGLIDEKNNRNAFLEKKIVLLGEQNKKVDILEKKRVKSAVGIQIIQQLQADLSKTAKVLGAIARTVPDGVYFEKIARSGESITFNGVAQSDALIANFMRKLNKNQEFTGSASLIDITVRPSNNDGNASRKFTLNAQESTSKNSGRTK